MGAATRGLCHRFVEAVDILGRNARPYELGGDMKTVLKIALGIGVVLGPFAPAANAAPARTLPVGTAKPLAKQALQPSTRSSGT